MNIEKFLSNILNKETSSACLFILPALLGTFIFIIIPVICSFSLSFVKWDLLNSIQFVGLDNYKLLLKDSLFFKLLLNTIVFALSTTIFAVIIPLILACIINSKVRFADFFKTVYFLPFITPMIVIGIVWEWIFDPNIGAINHILNLHLKWLYDTHLAMPVIILISVWKLIGYNMIIFLSGLSSMNTELIEAAKIDGAGNLKIFKDIIIPLVSPTIFFVSVITAISSFQVFDLIYLMTQGGLANSTNVLVYSIYTNAFKYFNVGKASSIAYILFAIIFVLTMIQWNLRKKLVYIEE